ncbi:MAG TPA: flagellar motor switch protein FliM [Vicinamibacterales bacterium]|nr:flagellar motor switch protein FliM [Vicinamibacterales bacterium]
MTRILTPEELATLAQPAGAIAEARSGQPIVAYDFRRPDRVSKDQIRSLNYLHDRFARNAATSLAAFLRTVTEISVVGVEQFAYSDFLMALPDPTAFYAISLSPVESLAALEINPSIAFAIVNRLLGGSDQTAAPQRALTDIEQNIVDSAIKVVLEHLTETWKTVTDIRFQIHARETRPQMLQVLSWNEVVVHMSFDVRIGDTRGLMNICVPASLIETTGTGFVQSWQQTRRELTPVEQEWLVGNLGQMPMVVTADLQTTLKTSEVVALAPGQLLNLGVPTSEDVNIRVGQLAKFKGRLAASGERAAVQITRSAIPAEEEQS